MNEIIGYIERLTYQNPENGYTVAKMQEKRKKDLTCIVGSMPTVQPGETVRCKGLWKNHKVHGPQFEVHSYDTESPADVVGIQKYLGSGLIKGIGPKYAERIVQHFKEETLRIIDETPQKLLEVAGLGKKRVGKICRCWEEQKSIRSVMIFLQGNGVSPAYAQKIFKVYGQQSIATVQDNPYTLARDIFGIGFKTADKIAANLGIEKHSDVRIDAGIEFTLSELSNSGHVCYPEDLFLVEAATMLELEPEQIATRINFQEQNDRIVRRELAEEGFLKPFLWLKPLYKAEMGIVREIERLLLAPCQLRPIDTERAVSWVEKKLQMTLAENQKMAVAQALKEKFHIITGGPGTGKSTITNCILHITEKLTDRILLAAPTGRAAKRMSEITNKKASTIHSLLSFDFKIMGFKKNRQNPLECDLIIIDEASMIDTMLMNSLLKAIPPHARVILVGDINQLPSVGPGNVLKEIINSTVTAVTHLNQIFRQAAGSRIITNAHKINEGKFPDIYNEKESDFFFIESDEPEVILSKIVTLVTERLPRKFRFHPLSDIQVLSPMKRGAIGTENLNQVLQQALNRKKEGLERGGKRWLVDDKVMQIRNNYQKEVFNGDIGIIKKIDPIEQQVIIDYEGRDVIYEFSELDEVMHAYAVSIHKYQGSECPCIVMPIHTSHFKLLHRNLLYTGVTRGKQLVILIGSKKAIAIAVHNDEVKKRYTGLKQALGSLFAIV